MKKCPRCGLTFAADADYRYCTSCGTPLEDVVEPASESPESASDEPDTPETLKDSEDLKDFNDLKDSKDSESPKSSVTDDFSEALGELGAAAKKVADKIGDKAKEGFEKLKEDETFSKFNDKAKQGFDKAMNTPDSTADYDPADVENYRIVSLFAYLGFLFIVPLIAGKDSKYARFHTNQGIILFIFSAILAFLVRFPHVGWIFALGEVVVVIFTILGIINAVTGKARELPLIGKFRILN
ncbi:MAG: hypothetical protein IKS80_02350 [Bacteroidaceae bacterium]|nr:hypothetical protein [Bacteroidaceae bacterium]